MLQLIDEKLSELYSIHGKQTAREATAIGTENKGQLFVPASNTFYRDLVPKAWGYIAPNTVAGTVRINSGFNISAETTGTAGRTQITFLTPMQDLRGGAFGSNPLSYAVIATINQASNAVLIQTDTIEAIPVNNSVFQVRTYRIDATTGFQTKTEIDLPFSFVVFGLQ